MIIRISFSVHMRDTTVHYQRQGEVSQKDFGLARGRLIETARSMKDMATICMSFSMGVRRDE